jgi:hypothetical protein
MLLSASLLQKAIMIERFALVCCGKQKLTVPSPAKDLYQSTLFKKTRAYAEKEYDGWLILSALHHVVDPDAVLEPYDVTLKKNEAGEWAKLTAEQLAGLIPHGSIVDYFGGALYEPVVQHLKGYGYSVGRPLQGLQIGQRLQWLTQRERASMLDRKSAKSSRL